MRVEAKQLVKKLTPTATRVLEAAVGHAATGGFYEISVEHLMAQMLAPEEGDVARLCHQNNVDRKRLLTRVERTLEKMKQGAGGRPVISEHVFNWLEDAWLSASVETGALKLRTGNLFLQLIARPDRYTHEVYPELEAFNLTEVKRDLDLVLGPSPETVESQVDLGGGGGGAAAGAMPGARAGGEALARFTTSYTQRARDGKVDPVFGRHREIRQVIDILGRRRKNNAILVGEPGVGKTALVEGLALAIVSGDVPEALKGVELLGLDLGALQAGASVRGEFENRLKGVINEVKASPRPIVMFIDEAHTLIGSGGSGGDAANLLKPALARGELRTVAATTWSEYKKYFEKDAALERRFQVVKVDEPSDQDAILMLRGLRETYEKAHGIVIRDEAVVEAVKLSRRYLSGRQLPDKAVDLLDTAAARVKIEQATKPEVLVGLEAEIAGMERERVALLRDVAEGTLGEEAAALKALDQKLAAARDRAATLEAKLGTIRTAVDKLRKARQAAATAPDDAALKRSVETAMQELAAAQGEETLVSADVDGPAIARVVASWTGIPAGKMKSDQIKGVLDLEQKLNERVKGQPEALKSVAEVLRMAYAGVRNPGTPLGVLIFVGPSGVGKTETALALADLLYGGERFLTTINMSEFQEKHTVSRLIGSPPGYVGYGEGGVLTEAVRQRPYSVVLLDECEKADLEVMNLFYQVFDKGMLSDGEGREIDFKNTLVILTSNLATDLVMQAFENGQKPSAADVTKEIRPTLNRHFKPALLARMTVVPYAPLPQDVLREIVQLKLGALSRRIHEAHGMDMVFAPSLLDSLAARCTDPETGARNVDHVLRGSLMPDLSRALLEQMVQATGPRARKVHVDVADDGGWKFDFVGA